MGSYLNSQPVSSILFLPSLSVSTHADTVQMLSGDKLAFLVSWGGRYLWKAFAFQGGTDTA